MARLAIAGVLAALACLAVVLYLSPDQVDAQIALLKDPEWRVRESAAEELGNLGGARAAQALIRALKEGDAGLRDVATDALIKLGEPAVPLLIACLNDGDPTVQERAARALGKLGDARAVEPLIASLRRIDVLKDPDGDVCKAAAEALGDLRDARAVQPLIGCLTGHSGAADSAARALARLGEPGIQALLECVKHQDYMALKAAAEALGDLGDPRAVQPLIDRAGSAYSGAHDSVVQALGKLGRPALQELLRRLKQDESGVCPDAVVALGCIGDPRALEPLLGLLRSDNDLMRWGAAEALGKLGDARAVEPLLRRLGDEHPGVRGAAAEALGNLGDARALAPLLGCLRDRSGHARQEAADALVELNWSPANDGQRAHYLLAKECWNALVSLGEPAVQPLIGSLNANEKDVRQEAAEALGKLGDARAIEPLTRCLKDEAVWVRHAARLALDELRKRPRNR